MPIVFKDTADDIQFEYCDALPSNTVNLRIKGEPVYRINTTAFRIYGFYRNSIYSSYKEKADLAQDIKERKKEYHEKPGLKLSTTPTYQDPLYHYSVATSLGAMKEWQESKGEMKSYIAYHTKDGHRSTVGFVHFNKQVVDGRPLIYIAQAGVLNRGTGIGRHLMECVLSHYPAGTEFYILTRLFNTEAKNLYGKRLKFSPIDESEVQQLGYDNRYCGFKHTTTPDEVAAIKVRQMPAPRKIKDNQPKLTPQKSSKSNTIKYGFFAATAVAAGLVLYKIFTNSSSHNSGSIPKPKP